jgi:regulator of RNase E activity RraA
METSELCARYRALYMPAVCDALYELGLPERVLPTWLRPLFPEQRIVGRAFTVRGRALEPSLGWEDGIERIRSYLEIFERLEPDSILVHVNGDSPVGHFGELTGNSAKQHGCVGCILDGNLRDIEGLREIGFQVFYRDLSPLNAIGRWEMELSQRPVEIGGVTVNPGDVVIGEFDGVLVVAADDAERVLLKAEEIVGAEGKVRAEMRSGTSPLEGLRKYGHI